MANPIDPQKLIDAGFTGDVLLPSSRGYAAASSRWSKLIERRAGLILHPRSTEDVAAAVRFAVGEGHEVAVKGGGHGGSASSSTEGGVVIDLSVHMASVRASREEQQVIVGGGARCGMIDQACHRVGTAVVGPSHSDVGVGGFILGGGYGGLTGKQGLGADHLIRATLVTAQGEIVQVDEETQPGLLWALRGAGCNLGPVTSLTLRTQPEPAEIFGGSLFCPPPLFPKVWEAVNAFRPQMLPEDSVGLVFAQGPKGPAIVLSLAHHGPDHEDAKTRFKPFFELGHVMNTTKMTDNPSLNSAADALNPPGRYVFTLSATHDQTPVSAAQDVWDTMTGIWAAPGCVFAKSSVIVSFWNSDKLLDPAAADKACFGSRGGWGNVLIVVVWEAEHDSDETRRRAKEGAYALQKAWGHPTGTAVYGNPESDQGVGDQRARELFGPNYARLQALKAKWDPTRVWNSWFPIVPAGQE